MQQQVDARSWQFTLLCADNPQLPLVQQGSCSVDSCDEEASSDFGFSSNSKLAGGSANLHEHRDDSSDTAYPSPMQNFGILQKLSYYSPSEVSLTDKSSQSNATKESSSPSFLHFQAGDGAFPGTLERLGSGFSSISAAFGGGSRAEADNGRRLSGGVESGKLSAQYKGVVPQPNGRWGAQIYDKNQRVWLGTFNREEEAARAYDRAALKYRGKDAVMNFKPAKHGNTEEVFLNSLSKQQVVDMLRRHTFEEELEQSRKQEMVKNCNNGKANVEAGGSGGGAMQKVDYGKNDMSAHSMRGGSSSSSAARGSSANAFLRAHTSCKPGSSSSPPAPASCGPANWVSAEPRERLFDKSLTPSDVGKLNRLVIPKQHAERCFPLDSNTNEKGRMLDLEDSSGKIWRFRYSYWGSSQSYVFTKGWSGFVKEKKLEAGDIVSFERNNHKDLFISCRHRPSAVQARNVATTSTASVITDHLRMRQQQCQSLAHHPTSIHAEMSFHQKAMVMNSIIQASAGTHEPNFLVDQPVVSGQQAVRELAAASPFLNHSSPFLNVYRAQEHRLQQGSAAGLVEEAHPFSLKRATEDPHAESARHGSLWKTNARPCFLTKETEPHLSEHDSKGVLYNCKQELVGAESRETMASSSKRGLRLFGVDMKPDMMNHNGEEEEEKNTKGCLGVISSCRPGVKGKRGFEGEPNSQSSSESCSKRCNISLI